MRWTALLAGGFALLLLSACPEDPGFVGGCVNDAQCVEQNGPGFICSKDFNPPLCLCTTDSACAEGEFCNAAGTCQPRVGCFTNDDCPEDLFCDRNNDQCIEKNRCTSDLHCPIGTLCNLVTFRCEPGCRVNGDCPLRQVCRCPEDDPECEVGRCKSDLCDDQSFCGLKELCELDPEIGDTVCVEDTRGPYCRQCERTPGQGLSGACDAPANYCLVDTSIPGGRGSFCGVDCSEGQPCPNGFGCHYVVILTQALCSRDEECPATGAACETDDDCPGGRCDAQSGRCAGRCIGSEGGAGGTGFCSCVQDLDCPQDTCDVTDRVCGLTRKPCQVDGNQCRGQLSCVNINGVGGCVIGRNCAPDEGITCAEVRAAQ
ncbi:MAG: hypothetical protein D6729_09480 [Deltaproteobacteria bacterium]|nr:MAG: hypothetical protein D6729_09480 [Deltaproteobacteria bacterium]